MEQILNRTIAESHDHADERQERERDWIAASRRGDAAAFNHLVLRWESAIYNLARRMLQDPDEAAEATQEVFLAAFRNIRRFRGGARFSSWLYRIAANHCVTRLKRRPRGVSVPWDEETGPSGPVGGTTGALSPETSFLRDEQRRQVARALGETDPDQRIVLELKFFQERTFDEIADILAIPASTTKSRFYAGLDTLRRQLARITASDRLRR
ncbi:MAG: sigma-70 family RNA polymerase sigma factor [Acidobacteriota bacterium]|nr:sigma-70 family RNA polymerase sigma factor [Acidobacteriota bacterium]